MNRRRKLAAPLLVVSLLAVSVPARAAQGCGLNGLLAILDPLTRAVVSAALQLNCTVSADPVAFGNYSATTGTPVLANGSLTVSCTFSLLGLSLSLPPVLVCYSLTLSAGGGTQASRRMASGVSTLGYNLYSSSAYTSVWGDGGGGSVAISDSYLLPLGTSSRTYSVHGRLPASQNVAAGAYADSISVILSY